MFSFFENTIQKAGATEEGEYGKTIDNPPDDEDGKNVTRVATEVTHENQGSITVVMNQGQKVRENPSASFSLKKNY